MLLFGAGDILLVSLTDQLVPPESAIYHGGAAFPPVVGTPLSFYPSSAWLLIGQPFGCVAFADF